MNDEKKHTREEFLWATTTCSLRLILEGILRDISDGKIVVKPSSSITPVALETQLHRIDGIINELLPKPQEMQERKEEKKGKKLN